MNERNNNGFTLVELSIVLVIIGLIVGGILVGRDLIKSATIRSQISQLERYQVAVNTFRVKYNYLPGDIKASEVAALGFPVSPLRTGGVGDGDGNAILGAVDDGGLYGDNYCASSSCSHLWGGDQTHENLYFWEDISANAKLIDGEFRDAGNVSFSIDPGTVDKYLPKGKIDNTHIIVYSMYIGDNGPVVNDYTNLSNGVNFFGLVSVTDTVTDGWVRGAPALSVIDAYNIDKKMDDGYPKVGKVRAFSYNAGNASSGNYPFYSYYSNAASSSASTCFNTSSTTGVYSTDINNGNGLNCGLAIEIK